MKLFSGWVISAGLVLLAGAANAQMRAPNDTGGPPYATVSDIDGPYATMRPEEAPPRYGPMLLPASRGSPTFTFLAAAAAIAAASSIRAAGTSMRVGALHD